MGIKNFIYKMIQKAVFRYRGSSESYIAYLRNIGVEVGERVTFYNPASTFVDITNPHLLKLGSDIQVAVNVSFVTHDYSWALFKRLYGEVLGGEGEVHLGSNIFIGVGATILRNTHIGDNVIIAAGSVVSGDFPSNCVIAGNPAKVIMTLDEVHERRKKTQIKEAEIVYNAYVDRFGKTPDMDVFDEYFWLFTNDRTVLTDRYKEQMKNCGTEKLSYEVFEKHIPQFNGFDEMIKVFENNRNERTK